MKTKDVVYPLLAALCYGTNPILAKLGLHLSNEPLLLLTPLNESGFDLEVSRIGDVYECLLIGSNLKRSLSNSAVAR